MSDDARPALVVLGTGPAHAGGPAGTEQVLADADTVFAFPHGPESVALFYAEAWRVERTPPPEAVALVSRWAAAGPDGDGVLLVAGDPATDVALGAVLDGLARCCPDLPVRVRSGARVAPPQGSPLPG